MKEKEENAQGQESWDQPLLTKHDQLRNLTGKSGEKATEEDLDGTTDRHWQGWPKKGRHHHHKHHDDND